MVVALACVGGIMMVGMVRFTVLLAATVGILLPMCSGSASKANEEPKPPPATGTAYSRHDILQTMYDDVLSSLQRRHEVVAKLRTAADWEMRRGEVLQALRGEKGLFAPLPAPPRPVPRVRTHHAPVRGVGFEVRPLLVETRPKYWVPASLWVPDSASAGSPAWKGAVPAVLYSAGHEGPAWRWDGSEDWLAGGGDQIVLLNLVNRGFVCLAFDPIGQGERQMYADTITGQRNGTQQWRATFEHEYVHRQLTLLGTNAASAWVWDMTRLLDYLAARPFVDDTRLSAAGCSGGGTQTAYFAAVDERVSAASTACYTSTFIVDYAPHTPESNALDNGTETSWPLGGGGPADGATFCLLFYLMPVMN
jgi:hypothetical protein